MVQQTLHNNSKKGQTTLDVVCNLLSRPPRPQWEKLVLQIPANVNGGTKLLKTYAKTKVGQSCSSI
jgi:hypothetical protein